MPPPAPGCTPCAARDEEIAQLREQLAGRHAEVTGLRGQVAELKDRVARLERAVSRNSGNSSMPPSGDDTPGRKPPRKQRRAAERDAAKNRRRGKQPGAPGTAMTWTCPDVTRDWFPEGACECGAALDGAAASGSRGRTSRKRSPGRRPSPSSMTCTDAVPVREDPRGAPPARRPGLRGLDRAAAAGTGGLPPGVPAPARGAVPAAAVRRGRRGRVRRVHPLLPREGRVDGRRSREADQDADHRLQGRRIR